MFNLLTFTIKISSKTQSGDKGTVGRNSSPFPNNEQKTQIQTGGKKAGAESNIPVIPPERFPYSSNTNIFLMR